MSPGEAEAAAALARAQLDRGQPVRLIARGRSMWPAILDGDRLTLTPDAGPPPLGAVVLVPVGDFGLTHRVVARVGSWCCLKGDAAVAVDGWFRADALGVRVTAVTRDGRAVSLGETPAAVVAAWAQSGLRVLARWVRGR